MKIELKKKAGKDTKTRDKERERDKETKRELAK